MVRRSRWQLSILMAVFVMPMVLGAIAVRAQGSSYFSGLVPRPALASRTGESPPAAAMPSRRPTWRYDPAPLAPRFDEFTVRAAINRVPAPPGTGLPGIERVDIYAASALPLVVNLRVAGADNPAWRELSFEDQRRYAREVLAALVATYPEVETRFGRERVYFGVLIWADFLATTPLDGDVDTPFICKPVPNEKPFLRCAGAGIGELAPVPAAHREESLAEGPRL